MGRAPDVSLSFADLAVATTGTGQGTRELLMKRLSAKALADLMDLASRMVHAQGYAHELYPAQWTALCYFVSARPDLRTASDLARFQNLANGPVSRTVRTLIAKGLLEKDPDQPKGRAERLRPSVAGREMLSRDPLSRVADAIASLDAGEQEALASALEGLIRKLAASGQPATEQ